MLTVCVRLCVCMSVLVSECVLCVAVVGEQVCKVDAITALFMCCFSLSECLLPVVCCVISVLVGNQSLE